MGDGRCDRFPIGVVLWPSEPWADHLGSWREIEQRGATMGWLYDHVRWRGVVGWADAYCLLAGAAAATSTIGLGVLVSNPNFRHPVQVAHAARTIHHMSQLRFTLGVGAGSATSDDRLLGGPPLEPAARQDRFEEWLSMLAELLAGKEVTTRGAHVSARNAVVSAGGSEQPRVPIVIAAGGPRGLRLAARYGDSWVTMGSPRTPDVPAEMAVRTQIRRLEAECRAIGRDPGTIGRILVTGTSCERWQESAEGFWRLAERYRALGITEFVLHWPSPVSPYAACQQVLETILCEYAIPGQNPRQ